MEKNTMTQILVEGNKYKFVYKVAVAIVVKSW